MATLPWPTKITALRPMQERAVADVVAAFRRGKRIVVLEGPTGSGKTVVAEAVRRALDVSALYVCTDHRLQDQLEATFPYAKVLKGRRNYTTLDAPERFDDPKPLTAADCDRARYRDRTPDDVVAKCPTCRVTPPPAPPIGPHCSHCHPATSCPYALAKTEARAAALACTNTFYLLTEANGPGEFSGWDLAIADECDRLEAALMGHLEVTLGPARCRRLGLHPEPLRATSSTTWADWVERTVLPALIDHQAALDDDTPEADEELELHGRLRRVARELRDGRWVGVPGDGGVAFKPVRVRDDARERLWPHAARWLLMSATIVDPARMLADLGADGIPWAFVQVPSTFDPERRRVWVAPRVNVVKKNPAAAAQVAGVLRQVLPLHPDERVLVHTVSHRLAGELGELLADVPRVVAATGPAAARAAAFAHYQSTPGAVLLAAGLERGVDLPDDLCRVVVVAKCPWPDLGDPQVRARVDGPDGRSWYVRQALMALVQMTGRGMRHEADRCVSYLIDQQLARLLSQHDTLVPAWWRAACVWSTAQ